MHISIISTRKESHPKIVLNVLAVGSEQRVHLMFVFVFSSFHFLLLVVFRHLIILTLFNISRLSFNEKKKKEQKYVQEKKTLYKRTADIRCHEEFCTWEKLLKWSM